MKWVDPNLSHEDWMESDPDDFGNPFFKGTDIRVQTIAIEFEMGKTPDEVLEKYSHLTAVHVKGFWTAIVPPVDMKWILQKYDEIEKSVLTNEQRSASEIRLMQLTCDVQEWEKKQKVIQERRLDREGITIKTQQKEIAKKMKKDGMAVELIVKYTGLSIEGVKQL